MDDDQATGTFVLPVSHNSRVGTGTPSTTGSVSTQFIANDLVSEFESTLAATDSDYVSMTPPNLGDDVPADVDLRDYFVAFDGMSEDQTGALTVFTLDNLLETVLL